MSTIAMRLATITISIGVFATVPALAAHKSAKASAQAPQYTKVERWDHGKKYMDYVGAPPPAPTAQDLATKRAEAAQRNNLHAATRWDHGQQIYDYTGTRPPAPTQEELARQQQAAAQAHHLRAVTRMDHGKKYTDYVSQ